MGKHARVGEFPGPRAKRLLERKRQFVSDAISIHVPTAVDRAEGAVLTDLDGNRFLDLAGGMGVLNVGHCPREVVEVIQEQAARCLHTDFSVVMYESYVELAAKLVEIAPLEGSAKCAFFNSGAEAVENAVKIARIATGRPAVLAFEGAFHGRTLLCMSLTSKVRPYKRGFGPFAPEVYRVPFAYCYRCSYGAQYPGCELECARGVERALLTQVAPETLAAIIVEPVPGEGGFLVPPPEFLPRLREICDRHGVLLILDEVQTGFGRTGRMFACEHWGVHPDLMCVAKSLAAGLPLSGVVGRAELMDAPGDSAIGGTFVGNPVACAAAIKVIEIMQREQLPLRAARIGKIIEEKFREFMDRFPAVGDVRALGAMVGLELVKDRQTKEPAPELTSRIIEKAMHRGVILVKCGIYSNVIRILCPLVIADDQLHEALDVMAASLDEACREAGL